MTCNIQEVREDDVMVPSGFKRIQLLKPEFLCYIVVLKLKFPDFLGENQKHKFVCIVLIVPLIIPLKFWE